MNLSELKHKIKTLEQERDIQEVALDEDLYNLRLHNLACMIYDDIITYIKFYPVSKTENSVSIPYMGSFQHVLSKNKAGISIEDNKISAISDKVNEMLRMDGIEIDGRLVDTGHLSNVVVKYFYKKKE